MRHAAGVRALPAQTATRSQRPPRSEERLCCDRAHHYALGGARRRCEPARGALRVAVEHDVPGRAASAGAAGGQLRERARERRVASAPACLGREVPGAARSAFSATRATLLV
jgi:hypothetical protein